MTRLRGIRAHTRRMRSGGRPATMPPGQLPPEDRPVPSARTLRRRAAKLNSKDIPPWRPSTHQPL
jgi:hypothetical protein